MDPILFPLQMDIVRSLEFAHGRGPPFAGLAILLTDGDLVDEEAEGAITIVQVVRS